jgi:hypothetical protein
MFTTGRKESVETSESARRGEARHRAAARAVPTTFSFGDMGILRLVRTCTLEDGTPRDVKGLAVASPFVASGNGRVT